MESNRKIIHVDMDAFFASIEQLDNPELRGQPVIVGGRPDSRGVVAACSYEARRYGVHSALPCARAFKLCPDAFFISPRMSRYREVSTRIMEIFKQYTELVEPLSLDEAFLDITSNKFSEPSATLLAQQIRQNIFAETGLTASAGVSCNKFVAKIASDLNKPNGITVITPEQVLEFLGTLPIGKFHGVGKVTEKKMKVLGIKTGSELRACPLELLERHFGKAGRFYYDIVRGRDMRPVKTSRTRKSIGAERTLREDSRDMSELLAVIGDLAERVGTSLAKKNTGCRTITLKVRYSDFTTTTRSITTRQTLTTTDEIRLYSRRLITLTEAGTQRVRLLGVTAGKLVPKENLVPRQLKLPFLPCKKGKEDTRRH